MEINMEWSIAGCAERQACYDGETCDTIADAYGTYGKCRRAVNEAIVKQCRTEPYRRGTHVAPAPVARETLRLKPCHGAIGGTMRDV